jgi:uncharacterized protein
MNKAAAKAIRGILVALAIIILSPFGRTSEVLADPGTAAKGLDQNVVAIIAGAPSETDLLIAQDIATVLDDGANLRVLPIVGQSSAQSVRDILYLANVDMAITHANVLGHFRASNQLGTDLDRIVYIAKLFNEEIHLLARSDILSIEQLAGQAVNFGLVGSGAQLTARLLFDSLGIEVAEVNLPTGDALEALQTADLAASIVIAGKPAPALTGLKRAHGLKLLSVPYHRSLATDYYPASLTHADYPDLIAETEAVDTIAVCAVLIGLDWPPSDPRHRKAERFVDAFFTRFDAFMHPPRHPKWREVNFAAVLEDWKRASTAEAWLLRAARGQDIGNVKFEAFLAEVTATGRVQLSDAEQDDLLRAFLEWSSAQATEVSRNP